MKDKSDPNVALKERSMDGFLKTTPMLICLVGPDDIMIEISTSFVEALGYKDEELKGSPISILETSDGSVSFSNTVLSCRREGTIKGSPISLKRKDGSSLQGIVLGSKWDEANHGVVCGLTVVDESVLPTNIRDAALISELRRKESLKNEFIAIASHELRTPIQPMLGLALLAKMGKISQEEAWDRILKEARRLQQLANDILDVSRIESGSLRYNMEKVKLADIIESVTSVQRASKNENVVLTLELDDDAKNIECEVDRARITQALMNIIGNAVKFTKNGEISVRGVVDVKQGRYDIFVKDTAGGIPESILPTLFGKFVTMKVGNDESHGSGLGLNIARAIVMAHKGLIYVCNSERGAMFVVRLPLRISSS